MQIPIASDHAGVELKQKIIALRPGIAWEDLGPSTTSSVDYPDFANLVARKIDPRNSDARGVLICGSGQGMAMRANKYPHIRAALVWNDEMTILARQHNDANILCLGARFFSAEQCVNFIDLFLKTPFEGGRHSHRVQKIGSPC